MRIEGYSDKGGREYNEDNILILESEQGCCVAVADGLGGHGGGDIASGLAIDAVADVMGDAFKKVRDKNDALKKCFEQANESVMNRQTTACNMKTTLAVLAIDGEKVKWAHLGDTRIYHFVDKKQAFCTFDHSVSRMAVLAREIEMDEIRFHKDRSKLLKVIGRDGQTPPELGDCVINDGRDHVFLLCTDGFWEYVTEDEMESTLARSYTPGEWLLMMRNILEKKVKNGNDNNSAIAVFIE